MKKYFLILSLFTALYSGAQNVVGYWYGTASVGSGSSANNYLVELILKQNNTAVQGIINYYFRNTFRSMKLNGNFNSMNRELSLYNIPVPYFGSTAKMEVDCMMDLFATLRVARAGSNLDGRFVGRGQYKYTCPDVVFDLRLNESAGNQDSVLLALQNFKETFQLWSPGVADTLVADNIINRPVVNYVIAAQYKERQNEIVQEIEVDSDSVVLDFYDNGEIDGDSISIFYNNQLVSFNRLLSTRSVHFSMKLDSTKEYNEVTMFADNLGRIAPNTALMLVSDGRKRHEVRMSSNLQKNATLRIRQKKKP
jgi:hypothetical protein